MSATSRRSRRLLLETLENRSLLAGILSISDATITEGNTTIVPLGSYVNAQPSGLVRPHGIALGTSGDLFVASGQADTVLRYDAATGASLGAFVAPNSGGLDGPHGIAFGPNGNLFIASVFTNEVLEYDGTTGAFVQQVIGPQHGVVNARGVAFDAAGNLYVSSRDTNQIFIVPANNPAGATVWTNTGAGSNPADIAFGPDGNLYVSCIAMNDTHGRFIGRYDGSTGALIDTFISQGAGGMGDPRGITFDAAGNLYLADDSVDGILRYQGPAGATPGAFLGAYVPTALGGLNNPIDIVFDPLGNLLVASRETDQVMRFGPATEAAFTISLNAPSATAVSVNYATGNSTATNGSDYTAVSGTITFSPGEISHTILVSTFDDSTYEGNETFLVNLSSPVGATISDGQGVGTIVDNELPPTKFYVADDGTTNKTFEYGANGAAIENYAINSGNTTPRGAASTTAGDKVWTVDANKNVYVYNTSGGLLGSWSAGSLASNSDVQGITTNGTDVWIVDAKQDKVFKYTGAASRLSGTQSAASSFILNASNTDPTDLVTDGTSIWVLNNNSTDKVFKYTVSGSLLGSWTITGAGGTPTGLTIDPSNVSSIWIVDSSTDRVYEFASATSRTSGSQSPATSFALSATNTNPQGIADPPAGLSAFVSLPSSANADSSFDSALLAIVGELDGLLTAGKKRK